MKYLVSLLLCSALLATTVCAEDTSPRQEKSSSAKESSNAPKAEKAEASPLAKLGWLVGEWVDQGPETTITTSVRWTLNRKFLKRVFAIHENGKIVLVGTQMIGWDPVSKRIHSWTFDSEGGFGEAYWIQDGNRWLAKKSFVLATGEKASAVNILTHVDDNTLRWQSIAREVGGELMPSVPEVTIVRKGTKSTKDKKQSDKNDREATK